MKRYTVGIVGATGVVGLEVVKVLERRDFPIQRLRLFASHRRKHGHVYFHGKPISVENVSPTMSLWDMEYCILAASSQVSRDWIPRLDNKCIAIDNSSAFRMDKHVPLVIPAINADALKNHKGIVANPNCTTAITLMALYPLHKRFRVKRIIAASYQAVSGAGQRGLDELEAQVKRQDSEKPYVFAHPIAFNVLPRIGNILPSGYTDEEMKLQNEGAKIMDHPMFKASVTCVRVPVRRAHSIAVSAEFARRVSVEEARDVLGGVPGIELIDEAISDKYPMPLAQAGQDMCAVGRIRKDCAFAHGLSFFVCGDQLLRGAALNAVEILEELVKLR